MTPRIVLYCALGGLPLTIAAAGAGHFAWWWLSGCVLAAAFLPVALFGPRGALGQLGVISPVLLVVSVLCTWSEALLFIPDYKERAVGDLAGSAFLYLVTAAVLAALARVLRLTRDSDLAVPRRSPWLAVPLVLAGGCAYAFYYLVFGGITYELFTKGYYPEATEQVAQLGLLFWAVQVGRGALMMVAVLPVVYTLRLRRWHAAVAVGMLVWVAGGLVPLLLPNEFMGATQRFIHIVEILTQNAALGATAVMLLRARSLPATSPRSMAAAP
jgi:hypothetical protein